MSFSATQLDQISVLGYPPPITTDATQATIALSSLEDALAGSFALYRQIVAEPSWNDRGRCHLTYRMRQAASAIRVLAGELEFGGFPIISSAGEAARVLGCLYLYHDLVDLLRPYFSEPFTEPIALEFTDAIEVFAAARDDHRAVLAKLFESCGRYGCRILEAEWAIAREGATPSSLARLTVARTVYRACWRTLTALLAQEDWIDREWWHTVQRMSAALA